MGTFIKIERYWPKGLKQIAQRLDQALNVKDFNNAKLLMEDILEILEDPEQPERLRVSVCFIIDQVKEIPPLTDTIVDSLMKVLKSGESLSERVQEFSVWALGQLVEESQNIALIRETMPVFIKFCSNSSEQVKRFATALKSRLEEIIEIRENLDAQIQESAEKLANFINERLLDMKNRADEIAKNALTLNYKSAYDRKEEFEERIRKFKITNQHQDEEITEEYEKYCKEISAFKFEGKELLRRYREKRGKREDQIRKVHCILRIQSKIYRIITYIESKDGEININELREETEYSQEDIIEILSQLVSEEIIPNFMLKDFSIVFPKEEET